MKQIKIYSSVFLIAAILGGITWQTATIANFYANQDTIEEEHCINKEKPELACHGKCHLKSKLETVISEDIPESSRVLSSSLLVFQGFEYLDEISVIGEHSDINHECSYTFTIKTTSLSGLLDPPEHC